MIFTKFFSLVKFPPLTADLYEEGNTFIECGSDGNGMTLINLYPELKSDALVKQQIDTYISNNNQIKTLKNDYINANSGRWWLYFGKKDISDLNFDWNRGNNYEYLVRWFQDWGTCACRD